MHEVMKGVLNKNLSLAMENMILVDTFFEYNKGIHHIQYNYQKEFEISSY